MANWLVILLFSVGAVLFFAVALSLTLIFKGRNIDSEIATNRHMRARGITCAAQDARHAHASLRTAGHASEDCQDSSCANCTARPMSDIKS